MLLLVRKAYVVQPSFTGQAVLCCTELERKHLPFCSQWSHSHNHLLLILSATSIKLFVETN